MTITAHREAWRDRAACLDTTDLLWFPRATDTTTIDQAIKICNNCPVMTQCRTWADNLPPSNQHVGMIAGGLYYE